MLPPRDTDMGQGMSYDLVVFKHDEREAFREAFASLSHDSDDAARRRREWWCFDNPNGGAFALIRHGDEIAATCYLSGKQLQSGDTVITCFEIGETATAPAHQRKGLFRKLAEACMSHTAAQGRRLIYGTPNSQAAPGWSKFGFQILDSATSWLFVLPSAAYWTRFTLPAFMALHRQQTGSEITAKDYIARTQDFARLNVSAPDYLQWRLAESPVGYRYFSMDVAGGEFLCALKPAVLGRYPVLVVSEHFLNGSKVGIRQATRLLKRVFAGHYDRRKFMGLYVHSALRLGTSGWLKASGIIPHRHLPICAYGEAVDEPGLDWFKDFQLSDCDIG